ncbi:unannotated protein [freshwater metagenome]|uniref:Unannotated protein n=1 Tax=freshwater metagenome TaxID=449393 RepID=A0A6J6N9P0_9ZZZZ
MFAPGLTWFLPDLDYGFDNHNDYFHQRQNQNNDMSFTHLLSSRKAWTKGRAEPEVHNYSKKQIIMRYSKRRTFGAFFRFGPRQEVKHYPQIPLGVLFYLWLDRPCSLSSKESFSGLGFLCSSYIQATNLSIWLEDGSLIKTGLLLLIQ